ncbi:hypothetical protein ID866_6802 [Astraeus odoratus]|nr:hypothetical protein ID866_6802 [Astraeus odoratus]
MAPTRITKLLSSLPFRIAPTRSLPASNDPPVPAPMPEYTLTQKLALTGPPHPPFLVDLEKAREKIGVIVRFRVLVMGRANAGKTTLLQRVCNTADKPEIFDVDGNKVSLIPDVEFWQRGYHDIEAELVFQSNPGFVFHDSCGFEAGSVEEFEKVKDFVSERATTMKLEKRIHAIWFCIPMTDFHRAIIAAEQKFFNECKTGNVPVMVLLTKADALDFMAIEQLIDEGLTVEEAKQGAKELAYQILQKGIQRIKTILETCNFPPRIYLPLAGMNSADADCTELMRCTVDSLKEEELKKLLVSTQQANLSLSIEYAVKW